MSWNANSAVWSWGVLMWELFSFGEPPTIHRRSPKKQVETLKKGARLKKPRSCPPAVWDLISSCWDIDSQKRPAFAQLVIKLQNLLSTLIH